MSKKAKHSSSGDEPSPVMKAGCTGCFVLFSLMFAVIGLGVTGVILYELWTWQSAQRWVETPAMVLESSLDEDVDSDGDATYAVDARYKYTFEGREYESDRVVLQLGRDNIGTYHKDKAAELEAIRNAGGATVCYVNPRRPAQAMLFRELRPALLGFKLVFATVFSLVGLGLLGGGYYGRRRLQREEEAKQAHPGKPWMWRPDWAAGRIRSSDHALRWFFTLFAVVWNAMSWPIAWNVLHAGQQNNEPAKWFIAIFPLLGAGVALTAVYMWLRRLRWGVSEFEMAAVPGVLGGPLAGMIRAPRGIGAEHGLVLKLACQRTVKRGDSTNTETVWELEKSIPRALESNDGRRALIPVKFVIPYDEPPSADDVNWTLSVRSEQVGVDYAAQFDVPVFRTSASSRDVPAADLLENDVATEDDSIAAVVGRMHAVLEADMATSRTIRFPPARNRSMAAFLVMFTCVWGGACYGLFVSDAPRLFPWVFSAFWILILAMAIAACFSSTWLEYGPRGVAYRRKLFGMGRQRDVPRDRIDDVFVEKSGTTHGNTAYRQIVMRGPDGRRVLVSQIARAIDAERLAADMRTLLGLDKQRESTLEGDLPLDFLKT